MSVEQWGVDMEINGGTILTAMIEDLTTEDIVEFVEELIDRNSDTEILNELYELMRRKHDDWLETMGVTETEYQTDYSPVDYDIEDKDETEDEDDHWTSDPDEIEDELEEDVDIFTTEDDK